MSLLVLGYTILALQSPTLREYVDTRFDAIERQLDERAISQARAEEIALKAVDMRLEQMNEFRSTLTDQATTFARIKEVLELRERIEKLERASSKLEGRDAALVVVFVVVQAVIGVWLKKRDAVTPAAIAAKVQIQPPERRTPPDP